MQFHHPQPLQREHGGKKERRRERRGNGEHRGLCGLPAGEGEHHGEGGERVASGQAASQAAAMNRGGAAVRFRELGYLCTVKSATVIIQ